jgi:hypothetical protein
MNQPTSYVVYDSTTGRILGTHSRTDGSTGEPIPMTDEEVLALYGASLEEKTRSRARVLAVDENQLKSPAGQRVHTKRQELVARNRVELKLSRPEIRGDGEDTVDIEIQVLDASGKLDESFNGELKVSTQRGRLSQPGGKVQAKGGKAKVSLRSVPETIDRVRIVAQDVEGALEPGRASVAFV